MYSSNGVPIDSQVSPLVPIVPLESMNDRNPLVLNPIHWENILSLLNEMHFTNGVPMDSQVTPLVGTNRTIGTNGRPESHRTQPDFLGK